ncbi:Prohead protease [uncultured Caudovirales phage]|uniref:Prohead protease n=1 Tax=uncultured Caudovirales phage TaxID=2100421 RepID=A0A6J5KWX6_9CAUD|nr:Prohead protease [uncultured Caudovirales phage]
MKNLTLICEAKLSLTPNANEADQPSGLIEAVCTTWGAREGADGRKFNYQPEGFADWAKEFAKGDKPLPMFLNHNDLGMPMGEWNSFEFDDKGMTAKGRLYTNTVGGNDLYQILKESPKMFGGVSVGAYADEAQMVDADGQPCDDDCDEAYFQITKGGLREVSVVMYPNNPHAEINKLEMFTPEGALNIRSVEKTLREAGLTRKDATTASLVFKNALEQREAVAKPLESLPNQSESEAVVNEADALLAAFEARELVKALEKRI